MDAEAVALPFFDREILEKCEHARVMDLTADSR